MLCPLAIRHQRWRIYDRLLISENRWRAQRYGVTEGLIDFGLGEIVPMGDLVEELIDLLDEDAAFFESLSEIEGARDMLRTGTSSGRQRQVYADALQAEDDPDHALRAVVRHLIEEFHADL